MSVLKAAVLERTQNPRKNLWNLKNIAFIEFFEFFWTEGIQVYQNWLKITQDISQDAKIAFNFLPDFKFITDHFKSLKTYWEKYVLRSRKYQNVFSQNKKNKLTMKIFFLSARILTWNKNIFQNKTVFKNPKIWMVWPWISSKAFLNNVPTFRFFCFFAERNLMDSSYILWNKFQDYKLRFILTNHILVTAWPVICRVAWILFTDWRQHCFDNSHINTRCSNTLECAVNVVQWKRKWRMACWANWFYHNDVISNDCIQHSWKISICNT